MRRPAPVRLPARPPARSQALSAPVRAALAAAAALVVAGVCGAPASAHDALAGSTPADGASVEVVPASVDLTFAQPPLALGSEVQVTGPDGQVVDAGDVVLSGTTVSQPLAPGLPPGEYAVVWRVTSADGHPISGELTFTATGGSAGEPASEPASEPTTGSTATDGAVEPSAEPTASVPEPPAASPGTGPGADAGTGTGADAGAGAAPWAIGAVLVLAGAAAAWWAARRRSAGSAHGA